MSLLSKLTIVIPTYNRQAYALRNMQFWSGKEVTVYVMDGTARQIEEKHLSAISNNVKYYNSPLPFTDRVKMAADLITTEFAVLIGDDEFLIPGGLEACIKVIESDGLIACLGRSLYFTFKTGKIIAEPLNHEHGSPWHPGFRNYKLLQNGPTSRIVDHMNPYLATTCYAVTRTDVWKTNIEALSKCNSSTSDSPEIALELACAYQGKSKVINHLMWLRSGENDPTQFADPEKYLSFGKWFDDPKFLAEKHLFINNITDVLSLKVKDRTWEKIHSDIEKACNAFSLFEKTRRFDPRAWIVNMHLGFKPMQYLIIKRYNQLMQKIGFSKSDEHGLSIIDPDLFEIASVWNKNGIGVDLEEIREINELIINFHKQSEKHETE